MTCNGSGKDQLGSVCERCDGSGVDHLGMLYIGAMLVVTGLLMASLGWLLAHLHHVARVVQP